MATFTSSLPDTLLRLLDEKAKELSLPKNKLLEQALHLYLEHLNRAAYIKSFKKMASDKDLLSIVEEGLTDYNKQLEERDNEAK
jgi:predicted transcriptional regulator